MTTYTPPIADMGFVMTEVAGFDGVAALSSHPHLTNRLHSADIAGAWVGAMAAMAPRGMPPLLARPGALD